MPVEQLPWVVGGFFGIFFAIVLYLVYFRPILQYALPNEEDLGIAKISLPQIGQPLNEGRICTARRYVQGLWAKLITNSDKENHEILIEYRDAMLEKTLIAQRCGRDKKIYLFDENPIDAKYHVREDRHSSTPVRFIPTQDSVSIGTLGGFEYIGARLNTELAKFGVEELSTYTVLLSGLKYLELAATGREQLKKVEERCGILQSHLDRSLEKINELTSKKGESDLIAGTTPLTQPNIPQVSGLRLPSVRQFFTWPQFAVLFGSILLVPNIMTAANIQFPDKFTVALVVGVIGYIALPFIRKLIGK